jgi:hypothetical protein
MDSTFLGWLRCIRCSIGWMFYGRGGRMGCLFWCQGSLSARLDLLQLGRMRYIGIISFLTFSIFRCFRDVVGCSWELFLRGCLLSMRRRGWRNGRSYGRAIWIFSSSFLFLLEGWYLGGRFGWKVSFDFMGMRICRFRLYGFGCMIRGFIWFARVCIIFITWFVDILVRVIFLDLIII